MNGKRFEGKQEWVIVEYWGIWHGPVWQWIIWMVLVSDVWVFWNETEPDDWKLSAQQYEIVSVEVVRKDLEFVFENMIVWDIVDGLVILNKQGEFRYVLVLEMKFERWIFDTEYILVHSCEYWVFDDTVMYDTFRLFDEDETNPVPQ